MSRTDTTIDRTIVHLPADDFTGLRRQVEVGLALAPVRTAAPAAAKALAAFLDAEVDVPVRLAAVGTSGSRMIITIAVTLGDVDDVKVAGPQSRAALALVQRIVDDLAAYDPALALVPDPASAESRLAARLTTAAAAPGVGSAVRQLVTVS
jgi:hypothetical protein